MNTRYLTYLSLPLTGAALFVGGRMLYNRSASKKKNGHTTRTNGHPARNGRPRRKSVH